MAILLNLVTIRLHLCHCKFVSATIMKKMSKVGSAYEFGQLVKQNCGTQTRICYQ